MVKAPDSVKSNKKPHHQPILQLRAA